MQYPQAIAVLRKLQAAAPPTASARIGEVVDLLIALYDENAAIKQQPPPPTAHLPVDPLFTQSIEVLLPTLTVLRGQIGAVRSGKLGRLSSEQDGALLLAEQQAEAAFEMADSLDMLTKLTTGQLEIQLEPFDGETTILRAWDRVREGSDARGHKVSTRIDYPLPAVVGDQGKVVTILADLLDNAIVYTPFGGTIRITADSLGTHVLFSVEDSGIGLQPGDKVGEPFWRGVNNSLVRHNPGSGLRIYLARQLLLMMGGELFFSGEPNVGSTFSFTLPAIT